MLLIFSLCLLVLVNPTFAYLLVAGFPAWISILANAVTWPITCLILLGVLLNKKNLLLEILGLIKSFKIKGVEVFLRDLSEAKILGDVVRDQPANSSTQQNNSASSIMANQIADESQIDSDMRAKQKVENNSIEKQILAVGKVSPSVGIVSSWTWLEQFVLSYPDIEKLQANGSQNFRARDVLLHLRRHELISVSEINLFEKLKRIKNSITHAQLDSAAVTSEEFMDYYELTALLLGKLRIAFNFAYIRS
ncbi:MAG: hypothetical protein PW788_10655 [Micavibrio sp.]|nr:hypothetical protein [Micavibrio sp.]